jgi:flagellar motor switch protein FliN/FliY
MAIDEQNPAAPAGDSAAQTSADTAAEPIATDIAAQSAARKDRADPRLDAVLDVDLPLVVRFGRAIMPLRSLADLGPGSVIDMGRSPDEPVDLLVGDRLIARGEVVIVGGNYGVRITELAATRPQSLGLEARA